MPSRLTTHDAMVLEKIKDPESAASPIMIDSSLPPDPRVDHEIYVAAAEAEKKIVNDVKILENTNYAFMKKNANKKTASSDQEHRTFRTTMLAKWLVIIMRLDNLIQKYPNYASARNNRVTALRGLYGDGMLVKLWADQEYPKSMNTEDAPPIYIDDGMPCSIYALPKNFTRGNDTMLTNVTETVLDDLKIGIDLLTPKAFAAVSPMQAKRLAMLHMQRGRLYHVAASKLAKNGKQATKIETSNGNTIDRPVEIKAEFRTSVGQVRRETYWSSLEFEEYASRDFMMAGRYGDKDGRKLAVATNSNAKLCGEIVKEAMRKEYAVGSFKISSRAVVNKDQEKEDHLWTESQIQIASDTPPHSAFDVGRNGKTPKNLLRNHKGRSNSSVCSPQPSSSG